MVIIGQAADIKRARRETAQAINGVTILLAPVLKEEEKEKEKKSCT